MGTLCEDRLDAAVRPLDLGTGERVVVVTKMGSEVITGDVLSRSEQGVSLRLESGGSGFYRSDLYEFIPEGDVLKPDPPWPVSDYLDELPSDRCVRLGEEGSGGGRGFMREASGGGEADDAGDVGGERGGGGRASKPKPEGDKNGGKENDDADAEGGKKSDKKQSPRDDENEVNPSQLPQDIRDRVVGIEGLDEEQVNKVLIDVNDAAMKSLRRVGVKEIDIYNAVGEIQGAVLTVLEKRKAKTKKPTR